HAPRPGGAVALRERVFASVCHLPHPPRSAPRRSRGASRACLRECVSPPTPPTLRAPAEPWRFASVSSRVCVTSHTPHAPRPGGAVALRERVFASVCHPPPPPRSAPRRSRGASRACLRECVSPPTPPTLRAPAE